MHDDKAGKDLWKIIFIIFLNLSQHSFSNYLLDKYTISPAKLKRIATNSVYMPFDELYCQFFF